MVIVLSFWLFLGSNLCLFYIENSAICTSPDKQTSSPITQPHDFLSTCTGSHIGKIAKYAHTLTTMTYYCSA